MKKNNKKSLSCYIVIFITAIIMCLPLFNSGIHTGHDGDFHISRTIGTIEQLLNGNSPFVISRFSNYLGFAWNLFYPPLTTIINVFFGLLTNNVVFAMKIFIFITFVASGISMYKLVYTLTNNKLASVFSSILYMSAPYRILNTYTRLAVGEMISFIFIPIIFKGIYLIFQGRTEKSYYYVLGTIALLLSHNISTLLTFLLGLAYVLVNFKKLKNKKILKTFIISTIIIILCVLFFEVPLLEQQHSANYEVFRYGKMYSKSSVYAHALNPLQLLIRTANGADSSMYFCIGLPLLFALLISPIVKKNINKQNTKTYKFLLIIGIIALIMSTKLFIWPLMPSILLMIQFPWRMLVLVTFCFSIIGGINLEIFGKLIIEKLKDKIEIRALVVPAFIIYILVCMYSSSFTKNLDYKNIDNNFYEEKEIIDTENEVSRYSSFLEYWPQKAIDSIDYIVNHDNKIHTLSGNADITNENKENGILTFDIKNISENSTLELPFIFYKGYTVEYISNTDSKTKILECSESEHGLVQISLNNDETGYFKVSYHATKLHKLCIIISLSTFICYIIYLIINSIKKNKVKRLPEKATKDV